MKLDNTTALVVCGVQESVRQLADDDVSQAGFLTRISDVLSLWRNRAWPVMHLKDLAYASNFCFETAPQGSEQFFDCETGNGFIKTPLGSMLRMDGCSQLLFCGCFAQSLVYNSAVHARALGFNCMILKEATPALAIEGFDKTPQEIGDVFLAQAEKEGVHILDMASFFGGL